MSQRNFKYLRIIRTLKDEIHIIDELLKGNEKFTPLIRAIADHPEEPSQKHLLKLLGISRNKLMRLLHELYEQFEFSICEPDSYHIQKTEYWIHAKLPEISWTVGLKDLKHIPRVGDTFDVWFIDEHKGGVFFKVNKIDHDLRGGVHEIGIYLVEREIDIASF